MTGKTEKQKAIYDAAAMLFKDKGYSATSVRDLAKAVDLKASSLYNHIGSKEEILRHICFANARLFLEGIAKVENLAISPEAKVQALIQLHVRIATEDVTSVISFNDEWRHLSEPYLSDFVALRKEYEQKFTAILEEGMAQDLFRKIDPALALNVILSSVRWVFEWYHSKRKLNAEKIGRDIGAIILGGLKNE